MPAEEGVLVEVGSADFAGTIVSVDAATVAVRDRRGRTRRFPLGGRVFYLDDRPVILVPPVPEPTGSDPGRRETASGSLAAAPRPARVARASRIWVEGVHDAELLERIWGDDLRHEGVVVEVLDGIDDLPDRVTTFGPDTGARLGILVDHLVPGSKESRIAEQVAHPHVLVTGHPFVDVWGAVKPEVVGLERWPEVPQGRDWKAGAAEALGFAEPADAWRHALRRVTCYTDLDRRLVGAVERLIDFVTVPGAS